MQVDPEDPCRTSPGVHASLRAFDVPRGAVGPPAATAPGVRRRSEAGAGGGGLSTVGDSGRFGRFACQESPAARKKQKVRRTLIRSTSHFHFQFQLLKQFQHRSAGPGEERHRQEGQGHCHQGGQSPGQVQPGFTGRLGVTLAHPHHHHHAQVVVSRDE